MQGEDILYGFILVLFNLMDLNLIHIERFMGVIACIQKLMDLRSRRGIRG